MGDDQRGEPSSEAPLELRLQAVEATVHNMQQLLQRCVVTTTIAALITLRLGREQEELVRSAGFTPDITASLEALEQQINRLQEVVSEVSRVE